MRRRRRTSGRGHGWIHGRVHGRVYGYGLALALLLTACTGGGQAGPGATVTPGASGDIVVASGRDVTGKGGIRQQLIDAWNARQDREHSGVHARLVELPGSADQQRSQLLGALQSGSAQYDIVNLDVTWVPEFAAAHLIRPLPDDLVDADVVKSVASTARWGGKLYAVPFNSDVGLLYYRRDHLKQAHVQDTDLSKGITWRQLRDLIDAVEAPGRSRPKGYEKGWTTQLGPYEGRTVNGIEAFLSATDGAALTDENGRYTATVQQLTDGLAELRARTQGAYTLGDAVRSDEGESLTDFADGRTAFLRHWPYAYRTLHQSLSDAQLGVAPLPGRAVLGGQNLALAGSSQQTDKARDLIRFLTSKESERCLLDAGFAATRESAYTADDVTCGVARTPGAASPSVSPSASPSGESADRMPRDDRGRPAYARTILLPALRRAVQRPRTPLYGAFTQTFATELGTLFTDDPPGDAELAAELDRELRKVLPG
ncbi:extracellular solute-binding protein [Streptomyces olivochromogenes]|uniref:ABC transporter substrate-binding protein n=1 Tax=Streptomyces olivochromogenes TaxID=1963 RepID=A0A250VQG4_STROL|nr:extracellular solute-binding protein [Streptomyces olivochromogenes]GAX56314.1 ABC transporter substrate-binding protein [Streptomyces olivochromogenes]